MNDNQVCFEYNRLLIQGRVKRLFDCINRDEMMHPFYSPVEGEVVFQCLSCNYKMTPGINLIRKMRTSVMNALNEELAEIE